MPSQDVRIGRIISDFLDRRARGEQISEAQLLADHPDVADEVRKELRTAEVLLRGRGDDRPDLSCDLLSLPDDSFPGYQILGEASRGGQGVVLKALQKATRRKVAIKIMRESLFASPCDDPRFTREVQILGALKHPRIVAIHDSGVSNGRRYLVMDYIAGQPLDVWNASGARPIREVLVLFVKICEAINAAHLKGIIHRDIKPGNIRVDLEDQPHILDFGLAKVAPTSLEDSSFHSMTEMGQFLGSVPWASPEQAAGDPDHIDTRTDVYALGVILFQLLTGRFPYEVVGPMRDVLDRICTAEPLRPSSLRKQIDDEIETIILKCLRKEPDRRYQTAGELGRDVQRYLDGEPIEAKRDSTLYMLRKTLHKHRTGFAAGVSVVLLIVAALVVSISLWRLAVAEKDRALQAERNQAHQRARADLAARQAEQARQVAERRQEQLEQQAEHLARAAYVSRIAAAQNACTSSEFVQALTFLEECTPGLRGWEWHYLRRQATPRFDRALQLPIPVPMSDSESLATTVCLSADGQQVAVLDAGKTLRVTDTATGQFVQLPGEFDKRSIVRMNADATRLACVLPRPPADLSIQLWEVGRRSGRLIWERTIEAHPDGRTVPVTALAISPDGLRVAFGSETKGITFMDAETGHVSAQTTLAMSIFTCLAFSPDGSRLACGELESGKGGFISIWEAGSGERLDRFAAHIAQIRCLAWSADGSQIASGSRVGSGRNDVEGMLKVFDSRTGDELMSTSGHGGFVNAVAFSPDGRQLASGGSRPIPWTGSPDQTLAVWDIGTGARQTVFSAHAGGAMALAWVPETSHLISVGWDGLAKTWPVQNRQETRVLRGHAGPLLHVAFSPDGRRISSCGVNAAEATPCPIRVWDVRSGDELLRIPLPTNVFATAWTPDGEQIISAGLDKAVRVWNSTTGEHLSAIEKWETRVSDLAISRDGQLLACVAGPQVTVLRLADRTPWFEIQSGSPFLSAHFSPDGRWLAAAGGGGFISIWDCQARREVQALRTDETTYRVRFLPDSRRLACSMTARPYHIAVWDVPTGTRLVRMPLELNAPKALDCSPDGRRLASLGRDSLLRIWDVDAGMQVLMTRANDCVPNWVAFSPDGRTIATAGTDGLIQLWETEIAEHPRVAAPAREADSLDRDPAQLVQ